MSEEALKMELTQAIAKAAIDGTLSENAVKQFTNVLAENGELAKALTEKQEEYRQADRERVDLRSALTKEQERNASMEEREQKCVEAEVVYRDRKIKLECADQRVTDHIGMVTLIFRNELIRRVSMGQELTHQPGSPEMKDQYGNVQQYHMPAGFEATPVKKDETEQKE